MNLWRNLLILSLLACVLIIPMSSAARSIWLEPNQDGEIRLEAVKPAFKRGGYSTFSMVWFLSSYIEINETLRLSADIPFAHMESEYAFDSSSSVGNPYLGLEMGPVDSGIMGEFGVRLPLASEREEAAVFGAYGDFVDRLEAFYPSVLSVVTGINYRTRSTEGFGLRLRLAPILWVDTGDMLDDGMEIWVRYSAQALILTKSATLGAGFSGRYFATDDGPQNFGELSFHEFGIFANFDFGQFKPSARVRFPMDEDLKSMHDPSFVLGLGIGLP